jgi:hypothetical protein
MVFIVLFITICTSIGALPTNSKSFCFLLPFLLFCFCFFFFHSCKGFMATSFSFSHAFTSLNYMHWEKIATFIPYSWDVEKNMIYILFHDCLNTFNWFSTNENSTQVCRIINENWKLQVKNKILLNIPKTHVKF